MTTTIVTRSRGEREFADQVARELVGEGYEVIIEPGPQFLPSELATFQPDILARRGDEHLIVETKLVPDPASAGQVGALAEAVRSWRNWSFRLVTAPREDYAAPWTREEAAARIEEGERLVGDGHPEAALLLLNAAAEAAGRRVAEKEGLRVQRWSPQAMFRELVREGLLGRDDLDLLERARMQRNLVAHGLAGGPAIEPDVVRQLAAAVRRLLAELDGEPTPSEAAE